MLNRRRLWLRVIGSVMGVAAAATCHQVTRSADDTTAPSARTSEPRTCEAAATFADRRIPTAVFHVSTTGDDGKGDGSVARPFRTIARAARNIAGGTAVYVHAGTYEGRTFLVDLAGTAAAPIWIMGAPGEARPIIAGGVEGLHLVAPRYIVVQNLEIRDTADNGVNVDDGDDVANPDAARFVVLRDLDVHDTGKHPSGIANCVKLSGVSDVVVQRSSFVRCGSGPGSGALGVNGVGVHRAAVTFNRFESTGFGGVQFKGGSDDIDIRSNYFLNVGWRGVAMGGSTGDQFFRPPLSATGVNAEAARIRVVANAFSGGETAAAFTGCVDCQFVHNTVIDPSKWALRILQEKVTGDRYAFAPASRGLIAGNIFYFRRSDLNAGEDINVGPGTDSSSFSMVRNVWYAHDDPSASRPRLPSFDSADLESIVGTDPNFRDPRAGDFRLKAVSAIKANGSRALVSGGDLAGQCYADAPSLGALQYRKGGAIDGS